LWKKFSIITTYQPLKNIWQDRGRKDSNNLSDFFTAFPDVHADIEYIVTEDSLVVVFLNFTGTHKGLFQGRPPTNKTVKIRSADLIK
jgi:predicted ester cyclase